MKYTEEQLAASYAALKRTARSDQDIIAWYQDHAQVLPLVPADYTDKLRLCINMQVFTVPAQNIPVYTRNIKLEGRVDYATSFAENNAETTNVPASPWGIQSAPMACTYNCSFWLALRLDEFVYATVEYAYYKMSHIESPAYNAMYLQSWNKHFPKLTFDSLVCLHQSGLAPEKKDDFCTWLLDLYHNNLATESLRDSVALPLLMESSPK